jgi:dUTP pyrophosphatase
MTNEHDKNDINYIRQKISEIGSENYSQEDFDKEFEHLNEPQGVDGLTINIVNKSNNPLPAYETDGASGMDLRANLETPLTLLSGKKAIIPTGIFVEIPTGLEMQIRPRSGLAAKHGITVLNSPGTIDSDYRGEIKVILINHGEEDFVINHGERIAQAVIAPVIFKTIVTLNKVDELSSDTNRGTGGFGSTGR